MNAADDITEFSYMKREQERRFNKRVNSMLRYLFWLWLVVSSLVGALTIGWLFAAWLEGGR